MSDEKTQASTPAGLKLGDVWFAKDAWARLMVLRMKLKITYPLMKYYKGVADDIRVIEAKNNEIVLRLGEPDKDNDGRIIVKAGTPEYVEYTKEFYEYLSQPSELKRAPFDLDALVAGIDMEGNAISANDLLLLEPFFNQKGVEEETG